ncbi:MAG: ribosome biogenesis GTPase YlqF [Ruminococcaceae bacterium]|nr:ribosome biogenesis GTPase YlqF [Oscillospiraceae bacterium]
MNIQWFPGHMTKAIRMMQENLRLIDVVVELVDARLPLSSRNPEIDKLVGDKAHLILLNKSDIADTSLTSEWEKYFVSKGIAAASVSSTSGKNLNFVFDKCRELLADKIQREKEKGIVNRSIKIMVCGVPNVGKSSFINKLSGKKSAITGDRPGVTKGKQWIRLKNNFELLDTPGILWPKFDDDDVGLKLAYTGAVKDEIMDVEELACHLLVFLKNNYPESLSARYKMTDFDTLEGYELLELLGKKRGFVVSGGEIDTERAAHILLDEFRGARLGNITLEKP